ncbi:MAG: hypothetical protein PHH22_02625 [Clostridia bacterium]|nr:hypothetical protein [Clostridia bacterium]
MSFEELFEAKMKVDAEIAEAEEMRENLKKRIATLLWADKFYNKICSIVLEKGVAFYNVSTSDIEKELEKNNVNTFKVAEALKQKIIDSKIIGFGCEPETVKPQYMYDLCSEVRIYPKTQ